MEPIREPKHATVKVPIWRRVVEITPTVFWLAAPSTRLMRYEAWTAR
jgi:hypothetical protein